MVLKPTPQQAVLVQERVQEAIHSHRLPAVEEEALREFNTALDSYLKQEVPR